MLTIYDIAKITGVSPATVSKVINNYPDVSDKTREKILKAFKEHNFFPSAQAQFLTTKKSWTIGMVYYEGIGWGFKHPFFSGVIDGIKKKADEYGYSILLGSKNNRLRNETFLEYFKHLKVDGIVILSTNKELQEKDEIINSDIPVVAFDLDSVSASIIKSDNLDGCEKAVNYLYSLGHRKIAHITGGQPDDTWATRVRTIGYKTAMEKLGLKVVDNYIVDGMNFRYDGGYEAMKELLTLEDIPTAVFVAGDHMAIGAIAAVKDAGLKVPDDISIIGFDDIELAEYVTPRLTTIRQAVEEIGEAAMDVLVKQINNGMKSKIDKVIPVSLVERDSCRSIIKEEK